ncbi:MAG: YdcF family protein [Clostridia bacterium]|nr:YdcF family protein [Clostridia bacterium]
MKALPKILLGTAGTVVAGAASVMGAHMTLVFLDAKRNHRDGCDYLLILGCGVIGADTPSPNLVRRMESAVDYLKENKTCFIVPCGGCFREGQKKSEAAIIADYMISHGIDENRILLEDKSTTTFENFLFAKEIIKTHSAGNSDNKKIAFLSSDFHLYRASKIAKLCGFKGIGKVSSPSENNKGFLWEFRVAPDFFERVITKRYSGR